MKGNRMTPPAIVGQLVERFDDHREAYRSGQYNEAQLREEFLNPFFEALGWDVYNKQGYAEAYKEVIHEAAIKVGGRTMAPDYCFRAGGGVPSFFVEAKKPSVDIREAVSPAYQLRRYAWSAKLPVSILTDFDELAVYDCRIRPVKTDRASTARVIYHTYTEYVDCWDELVGLFSPEAIRHGDLDKFIASKRVKKGTAAVDQAFLQEIESWRELLARNIALRNPDLARRDLNFAVQRTIDRIVFLRICEDRGIEPYGELQSLLNGPNTYRRLGQLFQRADDRYNSGLFYFTEEKGRGPADELTLALTVDDRVLKGMIRNLYYPDSPYEFAVLPVEILGHVYEQFLGKVIRLTSGHRAVVEDKPEVKKAGGVYYTPTYIVDYIVQHTVGKLLGGQRPDSGKAKTGRSPAGKRESAMTPRRAAKLRILDPACGSGSFLLGAYEYLLRWHRDWYEAHDPSKHARGRSPKLYRDRAGQWRLTTAERKRILLNNIYGVDIDPQAVEVTKLSLLLKVLEGESQETLSNQLRFLHERALPDLSSNIKCGNSLIGPDFYENRQTSLLDEEEIYRINAFDWQAEFPEIFNRKNPSFDAVIGNPPYGFHQIHSAPVKPYFKDRYVAAQGSYEHYFLFYERALTLLCRNGFHGFIVPVTWLTIPSAKALRQFVLLNYWLREISWLPELVFAHAQVNTLISIIQRTEPKQTNIQIYETLGFRDPPREELSRKQSEFVRADCYIGIFERKSDSAILEKMDNCCIPLAHIARPCSGYNPYEVGKGKAAEGGLQTKETVKSRPYHATKNLGHDWKPDIIGRQLGRYSLKLDGNRWVKYGPWLAAPRDPANFTGKRILVQEITGGKERRIIASYYEGELYHSRDVIPVKIEGYDPHPVYLLALINSKLMTWYHYKRNPKAQKGLFPKVLVSDLKKLPVCRVDCSVKSDKARHDRIVDLASRMLLLHKKLPSARAGHQKTVLQRQIEATDREIDRLVYALYGLTDEEIAIVEEATAP